MKNIKKQHKQITWHVREQKQIHGPWALNRTFEEAPWRLAPEVVLLIFFYLYCVFPVYSTPGFAVGRRTRYKNLIVRFPVCYYHFSALFLAYLYSWLINQTECPYAFHENVSAFRLAGNFVAKILQTARSRLTKATQPIVIYCVSHENST